MTFQATDPDSKTTDKMSTIIKWQIKTASRGLKLVELDLESL